MHPVTLLMQEIYRDHWGIPLHDKAEGARQRTRQTLFRRRAKQDEGRSDR